MFVDSVKCATLVNGVLRVELLYRNASGQDVPAGELLIAEERLPIVVQAFEELGQGFASSSLKAS